MKINSKQLTDSLNKIELKVDAKEPEYNLIYLNTPRGRLIIKTHLTAKEWLAEQNLTLKPKSKCLKRKSK